jgi:hypothetical protein
LGRFPRYDKHGDFPRYNLGNISKVPWGLTMLLGKIPSCLLGDISKYLGETSKVLVYFQWWKLVKTSTYPGKLPSPLESFQGCSFVMDLFNQGTTTRVNPTQFRYYITNDVTEQHQDHQIMPDIFPEGRKKQT